MPQLIQLDIHHDHGSTSHHGPSHDSHAASSESDIEEKTGGDPVSNNHFSTVYH